jgi:hypothetical protein
MAYRISALEVPAHEPFRNDALERRPTVEFLIQLIARAGGPFVLALDSPWGTGKTTLVRMLEAELALQDFSCIYLNAWQVNYVTDPLVALVSSIDRLEFGTEGAATTFKEHMKKVRQVASLVAKRTPVAAAKALTAGAFDLEAEAGTAAAERAGGPGYDIVEAFQMEGVLLGTFRAELEKAIEQLPALGKKSTLIVFVDEIDRCRPRFAIELLERIKHLFDVPNILFVLSLDNKQLEASVSAVYGQDINATEFLRPFIDLEYAIPVIQTKQFVESLFARFQLNGIFAQRKHAELRYDRAEFISFFTALADAVPLTLRAQERCMTRLRVVMDQTPATQHFDPVLVAVLIVIRSDDPLLYAMLCQGVATAKDVMNYLSSLPGGRKIVTGHMGTVIEAYFLATDENEDRKNAAVNALVAVAQSEKSPDFQHARELLGMLQRFESPRRGIPRLSQITRKIDLAAGLRE